LGLLSFRVELTNKILPYDKTLFDMCLSINYLFNN
jgi:hypothetical protein